MPRRAFEDIPNEILFQIVQDPSVQLPEQYCLSLTSRRLHSIAELRLYRSLTLSAGSRLYKFLRTIVSRPELGAITRDIRISLNWSRESPHDLDERELIILQKLAREKGMSTLAVSELERGWCRPYFSLLMHLLPKLESLKLTNMGGTEKYNRWAWGQGEYHGPTPVGLQSLSSLEVFNVRLPENVVPFISLPALNSLRLIFCEGNGAIHWDEGDGSAEEASGEDVFRSLRYVKRSSKLKELYLYRPIFVPPSLEDILQIPEALDTFIYECDLSDHGIDAINALRYHANSLTTLSLTLIHSSIKPATHIRSIVSFRDFPLLKQLTVSCLFLLGHISHDAPRGCTAFFDLLPSSLTSLTVDVKFQPNNLMDENRKGWMVRRFLNVIQDGKDGVNRWRRERGQRVPRLEAFSLRIWEDPINAREELEALDIIIDPRSCWRS